MRKLILGLCAVAVLAGCHASQRSEGTWFQRTSYHDGGCGCNACKDVHQVSEHVGCCGGCTTSTRLSQVSYAEPVTYTSSTRVQTVSEPVVERTTYSTRTSFAANDENFVRNAAMANLTEIELGQVALRNSTNEDVRRFAQRMIDDYSKTQSDLESVAQKVGLDVPNDLDAQHDNAVMRLSNLSGTTFDRDYVNMMVNDHPDVIVKFDRAAQSANNNEIRSFASKTLPILREHYRLAENLNTQLITGER